MYLSKSADGLKRFKRYISFLFLTFLIFISGCSTKKTGILNRAFHGLTARDNGYFNATLKVEEGAKKLADSHEDKFDRILDVFQYADDAKAKSVYPLMDEAIKKASLVIQRHSMYIKGREYNNWIDDNYLLIGKAQFYKHDFYTAIETFQYVAFQYKDKPIKYEAIIWLIKSYMMIKDYEEAETRLDFLKNDKKLPKYLLEEYNATAAQFYIKKKNYPKAIEHLQKAVVHANKRQNKTRYIYILGQLYQTQGDYAKASEMFRTVVKRNPKYEMTFNAQMNLARSFDSSDKNTKNLKKNLQKMLKDEKNIEYNDQIYFALAIIALKENDQPAAINYFNQSIRATKANVNQKALSYLELAKIYFSRPEYEKAQLYYDSTITFLSKDHPDYDNIDIKRITLTKLVQNLKTIAFEDSVQKVARLSPEEREKKIDNVIKQQLAERERKLAEEEARKQQNAILQNSSTTTTNQGTIGNPGSNWYFYNPSTLSFGYSEFIKRWGDRKLEDNWRRSNKSSSLVVNENNGKDSSGTSASTTIDNKAADTSVAAISDKKRYLKDLPLTDKQMEQSDSRIMDAYYNLATIYKESLQDFPEAIKAFEDLIRRYPENKYILQAYYNLYRINIRINNQQRAEYYKNIILNKFPDSEYAKLIQNPDYLKELETKEGKLEQFYEETYKLFKEGQYDQVIERKAEADKMFSGNKLTPKFDLLKTLAIGKTRDLNVFEASLKDIVLKYPNDPVEKEATTILNYIKELRTKPAPEPEKREEAFKESADSTQIFLLILKTPIPNMDKLKAQISDFNVRYFRTMPLETGEILLDEKTSCILVKPLNGKTTGLNYINTLNTAPDALENFKDNIASQFLITPENFAILFKQKNVARYEEFYKKNYVQ